MSKPLQLNTKHGSGRPTVARSHAIPDRVDFKAGNLHGETVAPGAFVGYGSLPVWAQELLRNQWYLNDGLYVVYSYWTPIAWWSPVGGWVVPAVKYSPTTTGHQTSVRVALQGERYTEPKS